MMDAYRANPYLNRVERKKLAESLQVSEANLAVKFISTILL